MSGYEPDANAVAQFASFAGCDEAQARFLLEAARGNSDLAMQMFYDTAALMATAPPSHLTEPNYSAYGTPPLPARTATPPRPRAPVVAPSPQQQQQHPQHVAHANTNSLVTNVIRLPYTILRFGFCTAWSTGALGLNVAAYFGDRLLPPVLMRTARGAVAVLAGTREEPDPAAQAQLFITRFKSAFGDRHPRWIDAGWRQAAQRAASEYKFLLVYLHSEEHQDTHTYCRDVICAPEVVEYANQHFVCWGGDVRMADSYTLASKLSTTTYPYMALLAHSGSRTKLVAAVQGVVSSAQMMAVLQHAVNEQGVLLAAERAEATTREMDRQLRAEQNQEYEAALAADQRREAEREAEREAARLVEQERTEAEARARAEAQAEAHRLAEEAAAKQRRREEKRAGLAPEAAPGPGSAQVRIRLPDGGNFQRCFLGSARVSEVYDFVDSLANDAIVHGKYQLCSTYPRKVYGADQAQQTLEQAGLVPSALLLVQPDE